MRLTRTFRVLVLALVTLALGSCVAMPWPDGAHTESGLTGIEQLVGIFIIIGIVLAFVVTLTLIIAFFEILFFPVSQSGSDTNVD